LGLETELEFLAHRAELLAADAPQSNDSPWTISDFWFDQSAAFAQAWLTDENFASYMKQYEKLRLEVARPRLIVLLDAPADELLRRVRARGRSCERQLTAEQLGRIQRAVCERTALPEVGPVLRISADEILRYAQNDRDQDFAVLLAEALAAMQGME
jgi:deoxyguanosine kinase